MSADCYSIHGCSKSIQNYILESMLAVYKEDVYNQINNSELLAIQCHKTRDVMN